MAEKKVIELEVNSNLGNLKQQLKQAQVEVQTLADKFGATSTQAVEAAKQAAILKDKIGDAKALTDAFNPDAKFKALSGALTGVAGGFSVVTGAMGAFGKQNEDVEKALLKVQSAMALASGAQAIGESIDSFKQLGAVIKATSVFQGIYNFITTGSFKAIASNTAAKVADTTATVAQGTATVATTTAIGGATVATKLLRAALITSGIGALVVLLGMAADAMGMFSGGAEDAEEAQKKLDDALAKTNETIQAQKNLYDGITKSIDQQTKRYEIDAINAGKGEKEIIKIRTEGTKRRIDLYKEENKEAEKLYMKYSKSGSDKQFEAAEKAWKESNDKLADAQLDFDYAEAERNKKKTVNKKENNKVEVDLEKEKADRIKALNDNLIAYYDAIEQNRQSKITSDKEKEQQELANKYEALYLLADKAGQSTKDLQEQQGKDSQAITKKYDDLDKVAKDEKEKLEKERVAKSKEEIAKEKAVLQELTLSEEELKLAKLTSQYEADQLLYKDNKEILKALDIKYAKDKEVLEEEDVARQKTINEKKIQMAMDGLSIINDLFQMNAGKSEKDAKRAFKAQKAFNLASALTNTYLAVTAALANKKEIFPGQRFIEAGLAGAAGAVQVAKIAKTQFTSSASSADTGGAGGGATAPTMSAPQFNVVGQSGVNQLASLGQQPVQAYVVSGQVTSQQALDRNRLANATLGG